jgi:hypothetical protein
VYVWWYPCPNVIAIVALEGHPRSPRFSNFAAVYQRAAHLVHVLGAILEAGQGQVLTEPESVSVPAGDTKMFKDMKDVLDSAFVPTDEASDEAPITPVASIVVQRQVNFVIVVRLSFVIVVQASTKTVNVLIVNNIFTAAKTANAASLASVSFASLGRCRHSRRLGWHRRCNRGGAQVATLP